MTALADPHVLYGCHDRLLEHKEALFTHLTGRWRDLFNVSFEVLLYDLTSTYFESDPPLDEKDKRRHGYSRDHRFDCVQIVIALIVTPEGLPLAYEVLPGNTNDSKTLRSFLQKIEHQYGKAQRIWCMDRGVPTEEVLAEMRRSEPPVQYLVRHAEGAAQSPRAIPRHQALAQCPRGREGEAPARGWRTVRVRREPRPNRQGALDAPPPAQMAVGAARAAADDGAVTRCAVDEARQCAEQGPRGLAARRGEGRQRSVPPSPIALNRKKLKQVRRREGRYLVAHQSDRDRSGEAVELLPAAGAGRGGVPYVKKRSGDPSDLPSRTNRRIEAHVFVAFLAYCLYVTLGRQLKALAPGLTARSALEKFAAVQMVDVRIPTTDGRELLLTRYTQPEPELELLLERLAAHAYPPNRRPKSAPLRPPPQPSCSADLRGCTLSASIT